MRDEGTFARGDLQGHRTNPHNSPSKVGNESKKRKRESGYFNIWHNYYEYTQLTG